MKKLRNVKQSARKRINRGSRDVNCKKSEHAEEMNMNKIRTKEKKTQNKKLKILTWNISGLLGRLLDGEVVAFIKKHDIICLQETFLLFDFNTAFKFPNYKSVQTKAIKLSKAGRPSGGIIVLYKKELDKYIKVMKSENDNIIGLNIGKNFIKIG